MINLLYNNFNNSKGLPFWSKSQIEKRNYIKQYLSSAIENILLNLNQSWRFEEFEAPILTPNELINKNYSTDDYFTTDLLALRPETTMGSYVIAKHLLNNGHKLPLCVYQAGKSFRKENSEQSMQKHKRFTEFYQLEFQCLYSSSSKADYYNTVITELPKYVQELTKLQVRVVESDRLPDYSNKTFDIEVKTPEKWLEICSISDRKDYSENIRNVEIAFGLDRLVLV
jgi:glycyl-tRNA synthetase